jgi:hypothetical protein
VTEEVTTPAERLKTVLFAAKQAQTSQNNPATWQALGKALFVADADRAGFYRRYSRLVRLPALIRLKFADPKLVGLAEPALRRLHVVEEFLANIPNLAQQISQTMAVFDASVWDGLDMAHAAILNAGLAEPKLTLDKTQEIKDDLEALLADIETDEELPDSVRTFLREHLRRLRDSLQEMDLGGLAEVRDSLFQAVGEGTSRQDVVKEHDRPTVKRFWEIVGRIGLVINLANGGWGLYSHAVQALEAGQPVVHQVAPGQLRSGPAFALEAGSTSSIDDAEE